MSEHPERWLSELYRASAREEPPRSLDAAVLDAACSSGRRSWLSKLLTWEAPLAAAAVIVVTATLVIAIREDPAYTEHTAPRSAELEAAERAQSAAASASNAQEDARMAASPHKRQAQDDPEGTTFSAVKSTADRAAGGMVAEEPLKKLASPTIKSEADQSDTGRLAGAAASAPQPPAAAAAAAPPPAGATGPATPTSPSAAAAPMLDRASEATAPMREKAPAQAAPALPESKAFGRLSAGPEPLMEKRARSVGDSNQSPAQARQDAGPSETSGRVEARAEEQPAREVWLERIIKLRSEGRHAEAKESLAAFRKRYPDYPLPEALKDL